MFWPSGQEEARPVFQAARFRLPERISMKMRPDHGMSGKRAYDKAPAGSRRKLRSSGACKTSFKNLKYHSPLEGESQKAKPPGNAGVPPATLFLAGGGGATAQRCRQAASRRERRWPVRMKGKAPLAFHPSGAVGQGCAGPMCGRPARAPGRTMGRPVQILMLQMAP